jgi:hypothetical protein
VELEARRKALDRSLGGAPKTRVMKPKEWLIAQRKNWETVINAALESAGRPERADCRSYAKQGIKKIPQIHLGRKASQMKERGAQSDRADRWQQIEEANAALEAALERAAAAQLELEAAKVRIEAAAAARKAVNDLLLAPATFSNGKLIAIADRLESGDVQFKISQQEANVLVDAMFPTGINGNQLYGQAQSPGTNILRGIESGLNVGNRNSQTLKGFANIEISRTETGFKYIISAIKGHVSELVAYLRGAAARQLQHDSVVLNRQAAKKLELAQERPELSRKRVGKSQGQGLT